MAVTTRCFKSSYFFFVKKVLNPNILQIKANQTCFFFIYIIVPNVLSIFEALSHAASGTCDQFSGIGLIASTPAHKYPAE